MARQGPGPMTNSRSGASRTDLRQPVEAAVPRPDWPHFLEAFSEQHHGWLVNIRRLRPRLPAHPDTAVQVSPALWPQDLPLHAVRYRPDGERISVLIGSATDTGESELTIDDVSAVRTRKLGGAHQGLRIDSADGSATLIEFRVPAEPEGLDGLALSEL